MRRKLRIRIRYEPRSNLAVLLTLAVLVAAFLGYLTFKPDDAAASAPTEAAVSSAGMRQFYLTQGTYNGAIDTDTVCAEGYHMASMWELLDPSNLKYNTQLGRTTDDSGQGPPTWASTAWVRTGAVSNASSTSPTGQANCNSWTTGSSEDWGTYVYLSTEWVAPENMGVWYATRGVCSNMLRVWCVSDPVGFAIFLPLVVK